MKKLEKLQKEIMEIMTLINGNKKSEAALSIERVRLALYEVLDFTDDDEDLVRAGKFLKIIEELESKL